MPNGCDDPVCTEIYTCKLDYPVADIWCPATYAPRPERFEFKPEPPVLEETEPVVVYVEPEKQPQPRRQQQTRTAEMFGRRYQRGNTRPDTRERRD